MKMRKMTLLVLAQLLTSVPFMQAKGATAEALEYDVVVYGGTPAGICAAIAAKREGLNVVLLEQTKHIGGLSTSGLNRDETTHMDKSTLGGLYYEFIKSVVPRSGSQINSKRANVWLSNVAEQVFLEMVNGAKFELRYNQLIESINKSDTKITSLTVRGGDTYHGKVFIDCTYEGDLMAMAGVSYSVGRESQKIYNESLAGVRYQDKAIAVSPYDKEGKLYSYIMEGPPPEEFSASPHPTCYNIRLNLTWDPKNSVPIEKPADYNPRDYDLLGQLIQSGTITRIGDVLAMYRGVGKYKELNNKQNAIFSMSIPGAQTAWAEASFEERERIHAKYRSYTHGLLWFLKTDPQVSDSMREEMNRYGFCADQWTDNDHWPWYLYIREARRMKGMYILTENDISGESSKEDVVHIGSHFIDSHHVARYAVDKDHFINEGRLWKPGVRFDIPYRSLLPKPDECSNLLVPVACSASHVAFCAIRLEPTWMHLGEVSGMAAALSIEKNVNVQDIDVSELQKRIVKAGMPLR